MKEYQFLVLERLSPNPPGLIGIYDSRDDALQAIGEHKNENKYHGVFFIAKISMEVVP